MDVVLRSRLSNTAQNLENARSGENFEWTEMYEDRPPWKALEKGKLTLNLPAAISSEIARLVTIEMKSVVSGSPRADYINEQYQRVVDKARDFTEKACALGGICLKPYVVLL